MPQRSDPPEMASLPEGPWRWRRPAGRITRAATLGALLCAAVFVLVTFLPSHAYGHDCGTWTSPNYGSGLGATMDRLGRLTEGAPALDEASYRIVSAQCDSALDDRRLLALVMLALGVSLRLGLPYVMRRA